MVRRSYPTPLHICAFKIDYRYGSRGLVSFIAKIIALARPRRSPASLAHGSRFSRKLKLITCSAA